jgi:antiviral helicase SLH1
MRDKADLDRQLPAPTQYLSLTTLMSSERSNDDIQSELVEILGFEGDGLALVEELLRPGVREALINDMRGGGKVCQIRAIDRVQD